MWWIVAVIRRRGSSACATDVRHVADGLEDVHEPVVFQTIEPWKLILPHAQLGGSSDALRRQEVDNRGWRFLRRAEINGMLASVGKVPVAIAAGERNGDAAETTKGMKVREVREFAREQLER
jgi:hypothetical protein